MILQVQYREDYIVNAEIVTRDIGLPERLYYDFIRHVKRLLSDLISIISLQFKIVASKENLTII